MAAFLSGLLPSVVSRLSAWISRFSFAFSNYR